MDQCLRGIRTTDDVAQTTTTDLFSQDTAFGAPGAFNLWTT